MTIGHSIIVVACWPQQMPKQLQNSYPFHPQPPVRRSSSGRNSSGGGLPPWPRVWRGPAHPWPPWSWRPGPPSLASWHRSTSPPPPVGTVVGGVCSAHKRARREADNKGLQRKAIAYKCTRRWHASRVSRPCAGQAAPHLLLWLLGLGLGHRVLHRLGAACKVGERASTHVWCV